MSGDRRKTARRSLDVRPFEEDPADETIVSSANHHVLPNTIHVRVNGVVNFAVSGFHQIHVYNPGKKPADVHPADPAALFMDDKAAPTSGLWLKT